MAQWLLKHQRTGCLQINPSTMSDPTAAMMDKNNAAVLHRVLNEHEPSDTPSIARLLHLH